MSKMERAQNLRHEAVELTKQCRVLEAIEKYNEAGKLQYGDQPKIRNEREKGKRSG